MTWLVAGLGNPGEPYTKTRHNLGYRVVDELAAREGERLRKARFVGADVGEIRVAGERVVLAKSRAFMNESGPAIASLARKHGVEPDHVVAVHDEIDLPFGEVQSRLGGGLAGHNGLKSLKRGLGDAEFWRVRVGVGRPDSTDPEIVSAYVLGRFREPRAEVEALIGRAAEEAERLVEQIGSGAE